MTKKTSPKKSKPESSNNKKIDKTKSEPTRKSGASPDTEGLLVQTYVSPEIHTWIKERAASQDRSVASFLRLLLGHVQEHPKFLAEVGLSR